ncbi:MAG: dipeptidase PepE [Planctomycetota bacterium]
MKKLLLISSSRVHGTEFLEHCQVDIAEHFAGLDRILFVPYALKDMDSYEKLVAQALEPIKLRVESIHKFADPVQAVETCQGIFVGGGNTFRLLKTVYDQQLLPVIRSKVLGGQVRYMGSSAGTNLACPTIRTSNDMPIVQPPSFEALDLVPFQINPHFIDADPNSTHQGETREQRLTEFHEENDTSVLGLREGSWIRVHGDRYQLCGASGMKLFRKNRPSEEFAAGDISHLK